MHRLPLVLSGAAAGLFQVTRPYAPVVLVPQSLEQGAAAVSAAYTRVLMAPSGKAFLRPKGRAP